MMIGKAGNTVTERVKGLERDPDDVAKKENDPPNGGSCGKSGASLKTASKKVFLPEIEGVDCGWRETRRHRRMLNATRCLGTNQRRKRKTCRCVTSR